MPLPPPSRPGPFSLTALRARARSLWRGLRRRGDVEAEMAEEFRHHQELRAADLVRAGLAPAEARRQARLDFGSAEMHKDAARAARGLRRVDELRASALDFRLGLRMLRRYPGLTLVGGLAMAFAIAVGAAAFEVLGQIADPTLPLPGGDRIVAVRAWDAATGDHEQRLAHELTSWRGALRTVHDLGAYRTVGRNLLVPGGEVASVPVAEISAAAFRVAVVPPLLGRALVEADERPEAPPVIVVGYDAWRTRFGGDPDVVGRTVRLDGTPHTVVGVMPARFAFPLAHGWWVPLRLRAAGYAPGEGPPLELFGRLTSGASLDAARAELAALGQREAADAPQARGTVRPEVVPFGQSLFSVRVGASLRAALRAANLPLVLFLLLVCGNVAMLMFARAATREGELVVRTALGASRGRVVMQLFAEALVLGALAAVLGLAGAGLLLRVGLAAADGPTGALPFWIHARLSASTVLYAAALTALGAVVAGVVPALKITRGLATRMRAGSAGGGGVRFGGLWTAVIVSQVAVTVAFPVLALAAWRSTVRQRAIEGSFPAAQFLMVSPTMETPGGSGTPADTAAAARRLRAARAELERRLPAQAGVLGVTSASTLPLMYHPWRHVEIEGIAPRVADTAAAPRVSSASVGEGFFALFGAPALAGRVLLAGDGTADARAVVVNRSFVRDVLGGRDPIGRRLRYTAFEDSVGRRPAHAEPGPWYEIVGVVPDLGMKAAGDARAPAGVYHPAPPEAGALPYVAVRVRGDPATLAPRLRALAAAVDPALQLDEVLPMDRIQAGDLRMEGYLFRLFVVVSGLALTLSLAGVYAVTSYSVARRTREVGLRVALGAVPWRVAATVVRRPLTHVAFGVAAGCGLLALLLHATTPDGLSVGAALSIVAYGTGLFGVCVLACVEPARRALAVQPTEALRADG